MLKGKIKQSKEELIRILQNPDTVLINTECSIRKDKESNKYFLAYSPTIKTIEIGMVVNTDLQPTVH